MKIANITNETCPVCKTDRYLNPTMTLLLSPCYHNLCESCINRIFMSGPAPCPQCGKVLKKNQFTVQAFEDLEVEKEVHIRQRISRIFNKKRQDFNFDLARYNDYLEQAEDLIFNLVHGIDIEETNKKIEQYREENRQQITANIQRQLAEDKLLQSKISAETQEKAAKRDAYIAALAEEKRLRDEEKKKLIFQLENAASEEAKKLILASQKRILNLKVSLEGDRATVNIPGRIAPPKSGGVVEIDREEMLVRAKQAVAEDTSFDPFDNIYLDLELPEIDGIYDPEYKKAQSDLTLMAGGYRSDIFLNRALWVSFTALH